MRLAIGALLVIASPAVAQRPTRADFEAAVLDRAAVEVPAHECEEDPDAPPVPARRLTREQRARSIGRVLPVGDGRFVAVVRIATGESDANEDLAYTYYAVVRATDGTNTSIEIDVRDAPFEYEEPTLRLARIDDVDDDGAVELFLVLETNTQVACGTGSCAARRTVVVELAGALSIAANIQSSMLCEAESLGSTTGTVVLRDENGDGHRDLVLRQRVCPAPEYDAESGEDRTFPCVREQLAYLWNHGVYRPRPPAQ